MNAASRLKRGAQIAVALVALPAVTVLLVYVLIDVAAPADRIVNRGRVWKCELLGGTTTVDLRDMAGLPEGLYLRNYGSVHGFIVADVFTEEGEHVGAGVWTTEGAAVDTFARGLSTRKSTVRVAGHEAELWAARECADRGIF